MPGLAKIRSRIYNDFPWLWRLLATMRALPVYLGAYGYDLRRYLKHTAAADERNAARENFMLSKHYHSYEKGLALPHPRLRFREGKIAEMIPKVRGIERAHGSSVATAGARQALAQYHAWHQANGIEMQDLAGFLAENPGDTIEAGTRDVTREALDRVVAGCNFTDFVLNRHSIRQFTGETVDPDDIERAVALAVKSPSVCNRSTGKIYIAYDEAARNRLLSFQNGNAGFGHLAGAVIAVASDMRGFLHVAERNQCWVDGGLFAMTLCYALHAQGYGTCMLNWSTRPKVDRAMREAFGIPDHDAIITLMAVGCLPETFQVAVSPRRPARDHIVVLGQERRAPAPTIDPAAPAGP